MTTQILTQNRLKELLDYNPDTGVVIRKVKLKNQPAGKIVGCVGRQGYLQTSIDGKLYKVHRLVWLYMYGEWPKNNIDHIDHNPANNKISNLRDVSCLENNRNKRRNTNSSSGLLGVGWHKRDECWVAHIEVSGIRHNLGYYKDKETALNARKQAEQIYHPNRSD
jgi:hypothetical protein